MAEQDFIANRIFPPGFLIAAPRSGSGKTTLALGLMRALKRRGLRTRAFKCGPDYIDPAFHAAATGAAAYNLDSWSMRRDTALALLGEAGGADIIVAEGAMGLFDGVATHGAWGDGSSADIAATAGWPVLLMLDISGQSQSAGAVALGHARFRDDLHFLGVILNRVASERHAALATRGVERTGLRVLGSLPRELGTILPERHLGLIQAEETADLEARLDALADAMERNIDIDAVLAGAASLPQPRAASRLVPPAQRIALARDAAFSFIYPHLLQGWRAAGAEILPFSPLNDEAPEPSADLVWLPGGYPELHAGLLGHNRHFLDATRDFAKTKPIHGECGGYMVLGAGLIDAKGERHAMLGLLGLETSFAQRKLHLGYRQAVLKADHLLGGEGARLAGHEFHYASILAEPDAPLADIADANGVKVRETGSRRGFVSGSFFHMVDQI
jgi:cobyrinic acid a,c-diamide synthase